MVDIESVTAGGGSIGWGDSMGFLSGRAALGRRAAGAGLLGRGGINPTGPIALVVLGYIDRSTSGGEMHLDCEAARNACGRLGTQIGHGCNQGAWASGRLPKSR